MKAKFENDNIEEFLYNIYFIKDVIDELEKLKSEAKLYSLLDCNGSFEEHYVLLMDEFSSEKTSPLIKYLFNQFPFLKKIKNDVSQIQKNGCKSEMYIDLTEEVECYFECYDYIELLVITDYLDLLTMEEYQKSSDLNNSKNDSNDEIESAKTCFLNSQQIGYMYILFQDTIIKKDSIPFKNFAYGMQAITGRSSVQLQNKRNNKMSKLDYQKLQTIFQSFVNDLQKEILKF